MNLTRLMTDKAWIESTNGLRRGPYKTKFGGHAILIFQPELTVSEGERIIQSLPDGSAQYYRVEGVTSNAQRGHIPDHISIRIVKDDAQPGPAGAKPNADANADSSSVPEEVARISSAFVALSQAIDDAAVAADQKDEARRLLEALADTPAIKAMLENPAVRSR